MSTRGAHRPTLLLAALPLVLTAASATTGPVARARPAPVTRSVLPPVAEAPAAQLGPRQVRTEHARTSARPGLAARGRAAYAPFTKQRGRRPWWNRRSGLPGAAWIHPDFPTACYQADRAAGGANASAWQVLWVHPDSQADTHSRYLRAVRRSVRGAQSVFAASAGRYIRDQRRLFSHSLAPRFVTTSGCQPDVRPVRVPAAVYDHGLVWAGSSSATPFGPGTLTDWLLEHGYDAPNRKYLVLLQSPPAYDHTWAGISEDPAGDAPAAAQAPTRDNPANYTSFSYLDLTWYLSPRPEPADLIYPAQLMAHEMTHAMGAMTVDAPHESPVNPLHPTDCWDLLCYNPPTKGQTYSNGCGGATGWEPARLARGYLRLDCNRDDYWAPATDSGQRAAAWTSRRWAVSSSSFLYGNAQPTAAQLDAHRRQPSAQRPTDRERSAPELRRSASRRIQRAERPSTTDPIR